ncbi:LysR family transcriptional regulator [Komagataeibacter xylinus]|uniref:LysR family transcriptional regulator n=1 Tax=Komagataeibacter xylinus TaxID=28448 RepID=UPI00280AC818|nr:LysR family transcriptional regulator [Komagataeibacter xylinus]
MQFSFRQLQIMRALYETGSMRAASARLNVSFAAISKGLKEMEQKYGCALYHKHDGRVVPTPQARRILLTAIRMDDEMQMLEHDLAQIGTGMNERVTIGYSTVSLQPLLRRIILDTKKKHPLLTINAVRDIRIPLLRRLQAGSIDLFCGGLTGVDTKKFTIHPLNDTRYIVLARKTFNLTAKQEQDWPFLLRCPWLLHTSGLVNRVHFNNFISSHGLTMPVDVLELDDNTYRPENYDQNRLIFMTEDVLEETSFLDHYRILPLAFAKMQGSSGLVWAKGEHRRPGIEYIMETVREIMA